MVPKGLVSNNKTNVLAPNRCQNIICVNTDLSVKVVETQIIFFRFNMLFERQSILNEMVIYINSKTARPEWVNSDLTQISCA